MDDSQVCKTKSHRMLRKRTLKDVAMERKSEIKELESAIRFLLQNLCSSLENPSSAR
jgi:hypothetical protein